MNNIVKIIGAAAMALTVTGAAVAPAAAAPWMWHNHAGYHQHYGHHYGYRGYGGPFGQPYYGAGQYGSGYYGYGYGYDPGAAIVGGLVGGVFGVLADRALTSGGSHAARCEAHYRTYSPASNTFVGNDGQRHICRL